MTAHELPAGDPTTVPEDATETHRERTGAGDVLEMDLPAEIGSVRVARRHVEEHCVGLDEDVRADVELVVSELVANAVRHGRPAIVLRLTVEPLAVDVAVLDHGPELPPRQLPTAPVTGGSGRGLLIVSRLAGDWGVAQLEDATGKVVWATLART